MIGRLSSILLIGAVAWAVSGCVSATGQTPVEDASQTVESDNPYGGFPTSSPASDEVILSLDGIRTINLSLDDLQMFPAVTVSVKEPFVQEQHTYTGVLLEDLLDAVGLSEDSIIDTVALNDYRYSDRADALIRAGAILAYLEDGDVIAMDRGGPVRIVFAESSPYFTVLEAWNWSLRFIREIPE